MTGPQTAKTAKTAERGGERHHPSGTARVVCLLVAAAVIIAGARAGGVWAQSRATIVVAAQLAVRPGAQAPFPIQIRPPDALAPGCFLRLRGLPPTAALSEGHSIAPGAWAIPVTALPDLAIMMPATATGHADVAITLVSPDGSVLAEARSILIVVAPPSAASVLHAAPSAGPASAAQPAPEPAAPRLAAPTLRADVRERALRLVKKGDEQLAEGAIAQARLLYERAAEAGLALGAMAMAATYDAVELQQRGVLGMQPDREAARRWYERARQLGAAEAEERLRRLGSN